MLTCCTLLMFVLSLLKSGLYSWAESRVSSLSNLLGSPIEFNKVLFGGLIGSYFSFLQYIAMPITGSLSDIYGRRSAIIVSLVGICVSYVLWTVSKSSFAIFLLFRTIGGLSKGNVSLSTAIMTDISSQHNRGKGMALIGISFSIGFIV